MKTVVITGGAGGIGREFSKLFAQDGYRVVVFSLLASELDALAVDLKRSAPAAEILLKQMDLSQPDAAEQVVAWCAERSLEIDVLVNNVGFGLLGEHVELDIARVQQMLFLNNLLLTKLTLLIGKQMKTRGHGHILIVSSMVGFSPAPFFAAYSGTKAYALAFAVAVARELGDFGVSVSCLCPGTTKTRFLDTAQSKIESAKGITRFVSAYMVTPDIVAAAGYRGLFAGKLIIVPNAFLKLQAFFLRGTPMRLVSWFVHRRARVPARTSLT
jgi:short-subunit dehydrogenase